MGTFPYLLRCFKNVLYHLLVPSLHLSWNVSSIILVRTLSIPRGFFTMSMRVEFWNTILSSSVFRFFRYGVLGYALCFLLFLSFRLTVKSDLYSLFLPGLMKIGTILSAFDRILRYVRILPQETKYYEISCICVKCSDSATRTLPATSVYILIQCLNPSAITLNPMIIIYLTYGCSKISPPT